MASSYNGVKVQKVRIINKLPEFINEVERRGARAVLGALVLGSSEASVLTPIDTGTLINSRFNMLRQEGTKLVGTAGYTAEYALPVHDPENPQQFRRASAEKLFLAKGFENAKPAIDALMVKTLKV